MPNPSARNSSPALNLGARNETLKAPPGQVPAEMAHLVERISCLHEILGKLEHKLAPVVRESPAVDDTDKEVSPVGTCGLARELRDYSTRLDHSLRRINALIDAIEL